MTSTADARTRYTARLARAAAELKQLDERSRLFVVLRTIVFFAAAILLAAGYLGAQPTFWLLTGGWIAAACFLVAITMHEQLRLQEVAMQREVQLFERLLARMERRWQDINPIPIQAPRSALADDLDLFGHASLWQWLALPSTGFGRRTLCDWLLTATDWPVVHERQTAVRELQQAASEREAILDGIARISYGSDDATSLADWATGARWLPEHRLAHTLSLISPWLNLAGLVVLVCSGRLEPPNSVTGVWVAASLVGAGLLINFCLTLGWGSWMHEIFLRVTGSNREAQRLNEVFQAIGNLPGSSSRIEWIRHQALHGPQSAVDGFRQLLWRVRLANLQRDPLFYFVYLLLQMTIAWDFRILESLERWQTRYGAATHDWFKALGECEALLAAATLADENPAWAYPVPASEGGHIFEALELGHPLLADDQRVVNDVHLSPSAPLLLVTGSNMAGKSTLLRALGLNQILARTGSPVCARTLRTPLFELATSIRVRDSLHEGVSFFMAELKRLKQVVDLAQQGHAQSGSPPVLFLLDEILQGTNSRERQIAVIQVIKRLLASGACGAISTHDLELADQPQVQQVSQIVHFREYFEQVDGIERMRFDYRMRPGPTPTTNALQLLKLVGLDDLH